MSQGHFGASVVTLTPAPTLDRTYYVNNLHPGGVNRADDVREELAGKGINVSRGLTLANIHAPGVVPIGNSDPAVLERSGSSFLVPLWV
jgi:1-phosphofructokinase